VYRERTKDIASARQKEYRKNNKGIVYAWQLRRKTIKIDAFVEDFSREEIFERDDYTCQLCGEKVLLDVKHNHSAAPTIDHIVPLSKGGKHERINVQCAHYGCNVSKGNRAHKRADYVPDLY
jgi:5-methylcytosine-specific restriction endonuclease McrA